MRPDLAHKSVLLLQGPVGPFFSRLAARLETAGASVAKINFNAGDAFFYSRDDAIEFRRPMEEWPEFLATVMSERRIDIVFLFGDRRTMHREALRQARARGIEAYVFEEGYIRPDYVTLEKWGVNAHSTLPRELDAFLTAAEAGIPEPVPIKYGFPGLAWYSVLNSAATTFGAHRFPFYHHHKDVQAVRQFFLWTRGYVRKLRYMYTERALLKHFVESLSGSYFVVPLQVYHDSQVVDSRFGSNEAFIAEVLASFEAHAPPQCHLVFKQHPLDRPYRDYAPLLKHETAALGISNRVWYVHDLHLPTLFRHARGTVVLNSTAGCSSLYHRTPVKVVGRAVYDLVGLTHQGELAEFWQDPGRVNLSRFRRFRTGLIAQCQVNGSFYNAKESEILLDQILEPQPRVAASVAASERCSAPGLPDR